MQNKIVVLDFGSQMTQLIVRCVREARVYCELHPFDLPIDVITDLNPKGIILSGGPSSVYKDPDHADPALLSLGIPILGICYGMQWLAQALGGTVRPAQTREFGFVKIQIQKDCPLFHDLKDSQDADGPLLHVWMSHHDRVTQLPPGFKVIAASTACPFAAIGNEEKAFYGVQFHPEVTHTLQGREIIRRFVQDICGCTPTWTIQNYLEKTIQTIAQHVGHDHVILGLSGGVDSSVAAALIHRAIGKQLCCVFVDNGLLRSNETQDLMTVFQQHIGINVERVNASEAFLKRLVGITDPEEKRKIIGSVFVDIFQDEARKRPNIQWLAQGTIYPDVIESAGVHTQKAHNIKSHHNVGGLPETLSLKLLEPLRELFKDEVRALGLALGLPPEIIKRHPFPGPGLAVRVLGEVKKEYCDLLRQADAIFIDELHRQGWYDKVSQAFAVFLPIKSVGVMGEGRSYEYVLALRAVETHDFMTAKWAELPYTLLGIVSNRIINEVRGINRIVYDISGKPPATIEWE